AQAIALFRVPRQVIFMRTLVGFTLALGLAAAIGAATVDADQLIAGANVNVVGGRTCTKATDSSCPFQIYGDYTVQRQNEGSGAPLTYADVRPRYIRTVIVDSGTSGRFLDKPWHAWDIPRPGANNTCTIPGGTVGVGTVVGKPVPQQLVSSGNLYIAYATFL